MDWQSILITVVSTIATALASAFVAWLTNVINTKIKDGKLQGYLNAAISIVSTVVKQVFQTYVEALKDGDAFTEEKQKEALAMALNTINSLLSTEVKDALTENFGDLDAWIKAQIEAAIYDLKNKNKATEGNP